MNHIDMTWIDLRQTMDTNTLNIDSVSVWCLYVISKPKQHLKVISWKNLINSDAELKKGCICAHAQT